MRFRLINYPSTTPVTFSHLVAAVRTSGLDVDPATQRLVTVHGSASVVLPANGDITTDPVSLPVTRGQDITLSIALAGGRFRALALLEQPGVGVHTGRHGRCHHFGVRAAVRPAQRRPMAVRGPGASRGAGTDPRRLWRLAHRRAVPAVDSGARWTDQLQAQTDGRLVALNYGVAGDRITGQAAAGQLPPRVATDVFAPLGVSAVMVEMGSNDIKAGVSAAAIIGEIKLFAAKVAATHETFIVATVPGRGDGLTAEQEQQRQLLNQGLRRYPNVADIDAALTDPSTGIISASYDAGDHIHPNTLGVAAMTQVIRAAVAKLPGPLGAAAR